MHDLTPALPPLKCGNARLDPRFSSMVHERTYRPGSDIDLTIEGESLGVTELLAIENRIDDLLLPWKFDLSLLHLIDNPALLDHIRRVGVLLYSADDRFRMLSPEP